MNYSEQIPPQQQINLELQNLQLLSNQLHDLSVIQSKIDDFNALRPQYARIRSFFDKCTDRPPEEIQNIRMQRMNMEAALSASVSVISKAFSEWYEQCRDLTNRVSIVQTTVCDRELAKWKRSQQLSGNGAQHDFNLDAIQYWFGTIAQILWQLKMNQDSFSESINRMGSLAGYSPSGQAYAEIIPIIQNTVYKLLYQLVRHSFIIEKQPPQVIKKDTNFSVTVRLLIGTMLGIQNSPARLNASLVNELVAKELLSKPELQDKEISPGSCGILVNHSAKMESTIESRSVSATFQKMSYSKIIRIEKKGNQSVTDEKFAIAFQAKVRVAEFVIPVFTLSLPIVPIVNNNQETASLATIIWDNQFAQSPRFPFDVPEEVMWTDFEQLLNMIFHSFAGKQLSRDSLNFLAAKALGLDTNNFIDNSELSITWDIFAKQKLPGREFTFWEWLWDILKLCRDHLKSLWQEDLIVGFVEKNYCENLISKSPTGTFLLRFSDSKLGGISIAFVTRIDTDSSQKKVVMTQPFTSRDFEIRKLADRIHDLKNLTHLWPNLAKDEIFKKYYSPPEVDVPTENGYVKPILIQALPGTLNCSLIGASQGATESLMGASSILEQAVRDVNIEDNTVENASQSEAPTCSSSALLSADQFDEISNIDGYDYNVDDWNFENFEYSSN